MTPPKSGFRAPSESGGDADCLAFPGDGAYPGVGTYVWSVAEDRLVWSPELIRMYGLERAPTVEQGFTLLVHPDDRTRVEAETACFMGAGDTYQHEFRIIRPDGGVRVMHDRGVIERAPDGRVVRLRGMNIDVTAMRWADGKAAGGLQAGAALEDQRRLELAYLTSNTAAWDADLRTGNSVWSPKLYELLGLAGTEPASPALFFEHVHPEDKAWVQRRFADAITSRSLFEEEFRIIHTDGAIRYLAGRGRVVAEENGQPARIIGVNYDVTERKQAEEHARLLMREVSHRSKNLLALVQAIARQTAGGHAGRFLKRFEQRIQALGQSQDLLVENAWQGVAVEALVRSQLAHFSDLIGDRIKVEGPPLDVSAAAAQTLGMALHELATNAGKYGALSDDHGVVTIAWMVRPGADGERRFTISWLERGGPPVTPPKRRGFGSTVLDRMARKSLGASVRIDYHPEGLVWRLDCPGTCLHERSGRSPG